MGDEGIGTQGLGNGTLLECEDVRVSHDGVCDSGIT